MKTKPLRLVPDERGWLMEILRADDGEFFTKFGQVYVSATYPGVVKAWHYHKVQLDNFACVAGMVKLVLVDTRPGSPTEGAVNEFFVGSLNPMLVQVPNLVYHGWKCIGTEVALVVNAPDRAVPATTIRTSSGWRRTARSPTTGAARMVEVLVTGGAGFIGSNFVRHALAAHPDWHVTTLDKLTYAGRLENLHDVMDDPRHRFVQGDIADAAVAAPLVAAVRPRGALRRRDARGPLDPERRRLHPHRRLRHVRAARGGARRRPDLQRFVQISTDEVYGSVPTGASRETDELQPRNPYSASKAGADRLAYSYWATYGVPVIITRASNNYGPYQFPEKVIPLFVTNAIDGQPVPLYGDGLNVRDWLHVADHCRAHRRGDRARRAGRGLQRRRRQRGRQRRPDQADSVADRPARHADPPGGRSPGSRPPLLPRHRQAPRARLGTEVDFDGGLQQTVEWYRENEWWWRPIKQGDPAFKAYYERQYGRPAAE